jgi:epoxide hydrolase 4
MQAKTPDARYELRHGYADLSELRLHYVEAGEGPLVLLLHGFPEAWFSWRFQLHALAGAALRVVAPDMRGYNLSARPAGVAAYDIRRLAVDVRDLVTACGAERAGVAGHDWGGAVAWETAMRHPDTVERLAVLNAPHPRLALQGLRRPRQLARSWYIAMFQLPRLPERLMRMRDWAPLRYGFEHDARPHVFGPEDAKRYAMTWSQPGAMTAMINYYRAAARTGPRRVAADIRPVHSPTLVIWGDHDRYLEAGLATPLLSDVPNLERVVRRPRASHWVHQDEPETVNELLVAFFRKLARV